MKTVTTVQFCGIILKTVEKITMHCTVNDSKPKRKIMEAVAITGGTGFIGSHLAPALVAQGHLTKVISRGNAVREEEVLKAANVVFARASITDDKELAQAFNGRDVVCHLTGINREREPGDFDKIHVEATARVVAAAQQAQVKKIVFVSFLMARASSSSKYLDSKWRGEEIIRKSGLDYTILKPGMVYGKGDQMIASIVNGLNMFPAMGLWPSVGFVEKPVNPIFIEDFVRILIAALVENRLSRQTVAVCGPDTITLSKAVDRVAKVMKKPLITIPTPIWVQYMLAMCMEKVSKNPLLSVSQVRMLSEGMDQALPDSDFLPSDLIPKTYFSEESIRKSHDF